MIMMSHASTYTRFSRRDARLFFSVCLPQHMRSASVMREAARAMVAVVGAVLWTFIAVLLAG